MHIVSDRKRTQESTSVPHYDAVVVGAGPYGLSVAAHLLAQGVNVAVFGKTLELWRERMPAGMFLRSHWWATGLSDPERRYSIRRFLAQSPQYEACYPLPIQAFIDYGVWFQQHAVPHVDETYVTSIERRGRQFVLTLADGRIVWSLVVIMAIGLYYYANRPQEYSHLPGELVSHSFEHGDFSRFAGKKLMIIGGGQSAVENSALLHELGAEVELITRRPIRWLLPDRSHERTLWEKMKAPDATIAQGWNNWFLDKFPYLFYRLPQVKKDQYLNVYYRAAASDWLKDRVLNKVSIRSGQKVTRLQEADNGVAVTLSNGDKLTVDHIMLSTGYKVNIHNLEMIHPALLAQIRTDETHTPLLTHHFESSVPGLFFTGLSTVRHFGPLYRFVSGTRANAQRVAQAVVKDLAYIRG